MTITPDDNNTFLVTFPDVPGAITYGDTIEEALGHAPAALAAILETLIKYHEVIPAPSARRSKYRVAVPALIEAKVRRYEAMRAASTAEFDRRADLPVDHPDGDMTPYLDLTKTRRPGRKPTEPQQYGTPDAENPRMDVRGTADGETVRRSLYRSDRVDAEARRAGRAESAGVVESLAGREPFEEVGESDGRRPAARDRAPRPVDKAARRVDPRPHDAIAPFPEGHVAGSGHLSSSGRPLDVGKVLLRDYINGTIGFEKLGSLAGTNARRLRRMLGPNGNPPARTLLDLLGHLQRAAGVAFVLTLKKRPQKKGRP